MSSNIAQGNDDRGRADDQEGTVAVDDTTSRYRVEREKSLLNNADNKGRLNDQITTRRYGTAPHNFKRDAEACVPNDMKIMQQRT
jgi:hypothetical protein